MNQYVVKNPTELSPSDINIILDSWDIDEWKGMAEDAFKKKFEKSEFHLLTDTDQKILCIARLNFHFKVRIHEKDFQIAELVGFVATEILKGYGRELLFHLMENLKTRNIEAVGFCRNKVSPFYANSGLKIFYYKVKFLREWKDNQWYIPMEDDDIISLNLSDEVISGFESLGEKTHAYLRFE
jgi:hypothetical protein